MKVVCHESAGASVAVTRKPVDRYGQTLLCAVLVGAGFRVQWGAAADIAATALVLLLCLCALIGLGVLLEPVAAATGGSE